MNVQSEDIRLDPELYDSCKPDINKLCQAVAFGNAQVSATLVSLCWTFRCIFMEVNIIISSSISTISIIIISQMKVTCQTCAACVTTSLRAVAKLEENFSDD